MCAATPFFCCSTFGHQLLLPCCGNRSWYLRHSRLIQDFSLNKQENTTLLLCVFGGSQTLLSCDDRSWYLRHSRLIRELLCFLFFRILWVSLECLGVPPGGLWVPPWPDRGPLLLPCCGDRSWYLRHSRLIQDLLLEKQENTILFTYFLAGSQTSLCCGLRA